MGFMAARWPVNQAAHVSHLVCVFPQLRESTGRHLAPSLNPGGALGLLMLASARAHVWEAPWKRVYSVRLSLLIKEEMSTCSLKHLVLPFRGGVPSHVCTYVHFLNFLVLFKVK